MLRARGAAGAALCVASALGAAEARAESFAIPPASLGAVAAAIGESARATIVVTDPVLAAWPSPGVHGRMALRRALREALRGTGARADFLDARTVRIRQARLPAVARAPAGLAAQSAAPPPPPASGADIVVTASKRGLSWDRYPGSVVEVGFDPGWVAEHAAGGTQAIAGLLPSVNSTHLGDGRDKLFIRGIADSSFTGPTQATTGEYLGDVRLNYNAPDPDLNLYDMTRVEVLEGPQGTLYGAGSLGGVIRLVPAAPDSGRWSVGGAAGRTLTMPGAPGWDGAGMLNIPIAQGAAALRLVVYGGSEGGYIADSARGLSDVNTTLSQGERFVLRLGGGGRWHVDIGYVEQVISSRDGQYAVAGMAPLTRASAVAQPSGNRFSLGYVTVRTPVGAAELTSVTGIARHLLTNTYDATGHDGGFIGVGEGGPALFTENNDINLLSHETRIAGGSSRAPFVAGFSALVSSSAITRLMGPVAAPAPLPAIANLQAETALFGEASIPLTRTLTGSVGARLTYANSTGLAFDVSGKEFQRSARNTVRPSFSLAMDWHPGGRLSVFGHYQQGYRAGGLALAPAGSGMAARKFDADDLNMDEIGLRLGNRARDRFWLRAALFWADWNHIQADLVDGSGMTYTANLGRGRIYGLDGELAWRPWPALTLDAALFLNNSSLVAPADGFAAAQGASLPNVAHDGVRVAANWRARLGRSVQLVTEAGLRHVGVSSLGVGPGYDFRQGGYVIADASVRLERGPFALSLTADNLGDTRANTFAFGNPFTLDAERQITPPRPLNARLGFSFRY